MMPLIDACRVQGQAKSHLRPKIRPGLAQLFLAQLGLASGLGQSWHIAKYNWGLKNRKWRTEICNSESLNNTHCTSSLGSLKDRWGYCYNSFTYFSPLIPLYTLCMLLPHAYYFLFTFLFSSTDFLSFHALPYCFYIASCTVLHSPAVCLLMCSLLTTHSLVTQYIRTG